MEEEGEEDQKFETSLNCIIKANTGEEEERKGKWDMGRKDVKYCKDTTDRNLLGGFVCIPHLKDFKNTEN